MGSALPCRSLIVFTEFTSGANGIDLLIQEPDAAIWDNRAAYHTATFDFEGLGPRTGHRVVGLGERPYLDPNSMSKSEYMAQKHGSDLASYH